MNTLYQYSEKLIYRAISIEAQPPPATNRLHSANWKGRLRAVGRIEIHVTVMAKIENY